MTCDNCKKEIENDSVYCRYCGKKHKPSSLDNFEEKLNSKVPNAVDENGKVLLEFSLPLGAIIERPDWHYYLQRASEISSEGKLYEALEWCNKAMELNPNKPLIYNRRGVIYFELDKNKEAINDYNSAIKLDPKFSPAYLNRGIIKSQLGLNQEAIDDYNKVLMLKPDNLNAINNRAAAKVEISDFEGARDDIKIVLKTNPNDAIALYILGKALLNLGEIDEATKNLKKSAHFGFALAMDELKKLNF